MPHWTKRTTSDSRRANGGVRRSAAPVDDYMDKRGEYEPFFAVCFRGSCRQTNNSFVYDHRVIAHVNKADGLAMQHIATNAVHLRLPAGKQQALARRIRLVIQAPDEVHTPVGHETPLFRFDVLIKRA